jgi:hypothetical protein
MRWRNFFTSIIIIISGCLIFCSSPIKVKETEQGVRFSENGHDVLFYQRQINSINGQYPRNNYIHPLYNLQNQIITQDFPPDHLHHRGVFWTWHQVWIGDRQIGDPWSCQDFIWDVIELHADEGAHATTLFTTVLWKSPQWRDTDGVCKPIVREKTMIAVYPAEENFRMIDFDIELLALEKNVKIGGSDDEKGYGGFSVRIFLPPDVHFTGEIGPVTPQITAVEGGSWMDVSGHFDENNISGVTILCHPSLPIFPPQWILRSSGAMQNPVFPGRQPVPLSDEHPLKLRYRLVLHDGDNNSLDIPALQNDYSKE